ncbi:hypothetical protein [Elizabethkingia meningoseptica]|uniref:hypothetical protein n=1 Tax=Elizabethkingia meningoseptica TaxID=238 RepID=UPI002DD6967F|nr:hypothetical protein [Elizabethkingia meningoseptica]MEC4711849.1 hypothetical protein [Elizabethkingia meningoseptica]
MEKKLLCALLTVLLCILTNAGALTEKNYEKINFYELCGVIVTYFNSEGEPYDQKWFTSDQPTLADCQSYQAGVIQHLQNQGYNVRIINKQTEIDHSLN